MLIESDPEIDIMGQFLGQETGIMGRDTRSHAYVYLFLKDGHVYKKEGTGDYFLDRVFGKNSICRLQSKEAK